MDGDEFSARILAHDAEYNLEVPPHLHHTATYFYSSVVAYYTVEYMCSSGPQTLFTNVPMYRANT